MENKKNALIVLIVAMFLLITYIILPGVRKYKSPNNNTEDIASENKLQGADNTSDLNTSKSSIAKYDTFKIEGWADNWFAAYLDADLIVEDSVSINTERSFNLETATFKGTYPLNLNFILKDYKEDDTGLEYINTNRQQMGDGGFIMQITDLNTNKIVAVSNDEFKCKVINIAPLDKSCLTTSNPVAGVAPCTFTNEEEPTNWKSANFDTSNWIDTTIHSTASVDPKIGYKNTTWDSSAEFIWGPDLETNNTVLCKVTINE